MCINDINAFIHNVVDSVHLFIVGLKAIISYYINGKLQKIRQTWWQRKTIIEFPWFFRLSGGRCHGSSTEGTTSQTENEPQKGNKKLPSTDTPQNL